jgi:hypothetical protein
VAAEFEDLVSSHGYRGQAAGVKAHVGGGSSVAQPVLCRISSLNMHV